MKRFLSILFAGALLFLSSCGGGPNPIVMIETSMGDIKVELYRDKAPITVKNFLKYVDKKHYDGTIFHRVIADFMIQGGGFTVHGEEKPTGSPIENESYNGVPNMRGTIAMARTKVPDSATDQFFINVVDNGFLNKAQAPDGVGYCVFGKVIDGMDVVDQIRKVPTENQGGAFTNAPIKPVIIESIRRVEKEEE